jgi:hypothetical protein
MALALVLVVLALVAVVLGALVARRQQAQASLRQQAERARQRYLAVSALNEVLGLVNGGVGPVQAARQVSQRTGLEVLAAGDRLLACTSAGALAVQMEPRAWQHVLFAATLDLAGGRQAFAGDPRGPAQGRPPGAAAGFRDHYLGQARDDGVILRRLPALCEFRPGGGTWVEQLYQGGPSFLYLGGGAGQALGWTPGRHRWVLRGSHWRASSGESFEMRQGAWVYRGPGRLAGTVFADGCPLEIQGDLDLEGSLIAWQAPLSLTWGTVRVQPVPSTLAVASAGRPAGPIEPWNQDRQARAGDLLLLTGASARLQVGDPAAAEETGGLVLAEGRLVKRGTGLTLAGVAAAGRIEIEGLPSQGLIWSGRISRQPPAFVEGGDLALGRWTLAHKR